MHLVIGLIAGEAEFGRIHTAHRRTVRVRLSVHGGLAQVVELIVVLLGGVTRCEDLQVTIQQVTMRRLRCHHELAHELAHQVPAQLRRDARLIFEFDEDACGEERE